MPPAGRLTPTYAAQTGSGVETSFLTLPPSTAGVQSRTKSPHASSLVCSIPQTYGCASFTLRAQVIDTQGGSNGFVSHNRRHRGSRCRFDRLPRVDDVSPTAPETACIDPRDGAITSVRRAARNPASRLGLRRPGCPPGSPQEHQQRARKAQRAASSRSSGAPARPSRESGRPGAWTT